MSDQDKPGTDWAAKHAAAGSHAQPATDRPYRPEPATLTPPSDSEVTTNPGNPVD